jgi:hypothetical protein
MNAGGSAGGGPDLCAGVTCSASDVCHAAGACDPSTGVCSSPNAKDGTACDTGQGCAVADACEAGTCKTRDPSTAGVDQSQLLADTLHKLGDLDTPGEIFTVGKSGWLTGIEVSIKANGLDPAGNFHLDLFDATGITRIASATPLPVTAFGASAGDALSATTVGKALFDLSSQCVAVTAGDQLQFRVTYDDIQIFCNEGQCAGGQFHGLGCIEDGDCVSFRVSSASQNPYAGGVFSDGGVTDPLSDLTFKTFVE